MYWGVAYDLSDTVYDLSLSEIPVSGEGVTKYTGRFHSELTDPQT